MTTYAHQLAAAVIEAAAKICDEQSERARTSPGSARASACSDRIRSLDIDAIIARALDPWQPIETASKDGSEVLLLVKKRAGIPGKQLVGHYMPGGHCIDDHPPIAAGWYFWNGCMFDQAAEPTHWAPLYAAPVSPKGGKND